MTADVPALSTSADVEAVRALAYKHCDGCDFGQALGDDEAVRAALAAALSTPPTEGTTVTEWGVRAEGRDGSEHIGRPLTSRAEAESSAKRLRHIWDEGGAQPSEMDTIRLVSRQRTSYPDRVTEWTEVTE